MKNKPLIITGSTEDVPRLILAGGKSPSEVEYALLLRPADGVGTLVFVTTVGKGKAAVSTIEQWLADPVKGSDAPGKPSPSTLTFQELPGLFKSLKANVKAGPSVVKGTWRGELAWSGPLPVLTLSRKIASYATLQITSEAGRGWTARVNRSEKWFAKSGMATLGTHAQLSTAIREGIAGALGLVREACGIRDTTRRDAVDAAFAAQHPRRAATERVDPTRKLTEKRRNVPTLARTPAGPDCPTCVDGVTSAAAEVKKDAQKMKAEADRGAVGELVPTLARAAALIRRTEALIESPLCAGAEKADARAALAEASQVYAEARLAVNKAASDDLAVGAVHLRRIAERVALAAAKAAKACASGQKSLTHGHVPARPAAEAANRGRSVSDAEKNAALLAGKVASFSEALVELEALVKDKKAVAASIQAAKARLERLAAPLVTGAHAGVLSNKLSQRFEAARSAADARLEAPSATRAPSAQTPAAPPSATRSRRAPAVDPNKEALLMGAFTNGIKDLAAELRGAGARA